MEAAAAADPNPQSKLYKSTADMWGRRPNRCRMRSLDKSFSNVPKFLWPGIDLGEQAEEEAEVGVEVKDLLDGGIKIYDN